MEKIKAKSYNEESSIIVLKNSDDIEKFMGKLENNEDFILEFGERSILVVADLFLAKIKTGDLQLGAEQ